VLILFIKLAKSTKRKAWIILGVVYALNPGVFFNSSIWGQFDSIPATLLVGMIYAFSVNRKMTAVVLYAIAVLTKPQSALLTPLAYFFTKNCLTFPTSQKKRLLKVSRKHWWLFV